MGLIIATNNVPTALMPGSAENGIIILNNKYGLGGSLIRNTTITGAFSLAFTQSNIGIGTTASADHQLIVQRTINNPTNGAASILCQSSYAPTGPLNTTNYYSLAANMVLDISSTALTGTESFNRTAILGSLVISGNNGSNSTAPLSAIRAGIVCNGNTRLQDIRLLEAKTPEYFSTANAITNLYGLYIQALAGANVTNAYGIYQPGSNDVNYFAGRVGIGTNTPTAGTLLHLSTPSGPTTMVLQGNITWYITAQTSTIYGGSFVLRNQTSTADVLTINSAGQMLLLINGVTGQTSASRSVDVRRDTTGANYLRLNNVNTTSGTSGVELTVNTNTWIIATGNNVTDARLVFVNGSGTIYFTTNGSIQTANPTSGTAVPFRIGSLITAAAALDTTRYIQADINGTAVRLLIST
jgi:hypothetical protein